MRPWDIGYDLSKECGFESFERWQMWVKKQMCEQAVEQWGELSVIDTAVLFANLYSVFCDVYDKK